MPHLSIFPFSFRPLVVCRGMAKAHFGPSRLSCAWHHLKLVQVSGGLFAALPLRMFAVPKKPSFVSLAFQQALFSVCFFLSGKKTVIEISANSQMRAGLLSIYTIVSVVK